MKIRLYFDEDAMDSDLIDTLRARSVDLETVFEAGMVGREDRAVDVRHKRKPRRIQLKH